MSFSPIDRSDNAMALQRFQIAQCDYFTVVLWFPYSVRVYLCAKYLLMLQRDSFPTGMNKSVQVWASQHVFPSLVVVLGGRRRHNCNTQNMFSEGFKRRKKVLSLQIWLVT